MEGQNVGSSNYLIHSLGNQNGLNSSDITALFQDQDGFIWVGNKPGVSRYDGFQFVNFTKTADGFVAKVLTMCACCHRYKQIVAVLSEAKVPHSVLSDVF